MLEVKVDTTIRDAKDYIGEVSPAFLFDQEVEMAMFRQGQYSRKPGILSRLKVAFNYIRTGEMWTDQVLLSSETAKELTDFINENLGKRDAD